MTGCPALDPLHGPFCVSAPAPKRSVRSLFFCGEMTLRISSLQLNRTSRIAQAKHDQHSLHTIIPRFLLKKLCDTKCDSSPDTVARLDGRMRTVDSQHKSDQITRNESPCSRPSGVPLISVEGGEYCRVSAAGRTPDPSLCQWSTRAGRKEGNRKGGAPMMAVAPAIKTWFDQGNERQDDGWESVSTRRARHEGYMQM